MLRSGTFVVHVHLLLYQRRPDVACSCRTELCPQWKISALRALGDQSGLLLLVYFGPQIGKRQSRPRPLTPKAKPECGKAQTGGDPIG